MIKIQKYLKIIILNSSNSHILLHGHFTHHIIYIWHFVIIFQPLTNLGVASDSPGVFVGLITHFEIGLIKSPRPYMYVCMYVCRCLLLCTVLFLDFLPASSFIRVYFAGVSSDRFKLSILLILILNNPQSIRKIKIAAGRRGRG